MSWTYNGEIDTNDLDWIRFTIGDTVESNPLLEDQIIEGALKIQGTKQKAAKMCMENILLQYAQKADFKIGSTSVTQKNIYEAYKKYYEGYSKDLKSASLKPQQPEYPYGTPIFTIGMMDEGGANASRTKKTL